MIGLYKHVSAVGIAQPSLHEVQLNTACLTGEYAVRWPDVYAEGALYSIICYVNGYPHKRILSLDLDGLVRRVRDWLVDPTRIDP